MCSGYRWTILRADAWHMGTWPHRGKGRTRRSGWGDVIRHLAGILNVFLLRVMSFVLPVFLYHIGKDFEIYNTAYFISQGVFRSTSECRSRNQKKGGLTQRRRERREKLTSGNIKSFNTGGHWGRQILFLDFRSWTLDPSSYHSTLKMPPPARSLHGILRQTPGGIFNVLSGYSGTAESRRWLRGR